MSIIPPKTYELRIEFENTDSSNARLIKDNLKEWLIINGIESFVEGSIDNIDIDHRYDQTIDSYYDELEENQSPLSVFDYSLEFLEDLSAKIRANFRQVTPEIVSIDSKVWMDGWKESFKPIFSDRFIIHPPWDLPAEDGRCLIEIEPGMAFGTGQHATTQLCVSVIEKLDPEIVGRSFLDVGTGTGVLSLVAGKTGFTDIFATDIDHSSVLAARENARINKVEMSCAQDSVPLNKIEKGELCQFDVVVANILFVVLSKIIGDLAVGTRNGGILILCGLLEEQSDEMISKAESHGLTLRAKTTEIGWVCSELVKK